MLRVLFALPAFYPAIRLGGTVLASWNLARGLVAAGCAVRVVTTDADYGGRLDVSDGERRTLGGVETFFYRRRGPLAQAPGLYRALPEQIRWAEVVHTATIYDPLVPLSLLLARRLRRPTVLSPCGSLDPWPQAYRAGKKWLFNHLLLNPALRRVDLLHVTSQEEADGVRAYGYRGALALLPNGFDEDGCRALPERGSWRGTRFPPDAEVVGWLGRIHPIKGLDVALAALDLLRRERPRAVLALAGPDGEGFLPALQATQHKIGLGSEAVLWVGPLDSEQVWPFLHDLDLFIHPSLHENFGIAIAEALAAATPVVVSDRTPWSAVEAEGCGSVVPVEAGALARAMGDLLSRAAAERRAMGERGRRWVLSRFGHRHVAREMVEVYRGVVAGAAGAGG
jgi:glycosyltransferase involved in cell wall biosynthesis